MKCSIFIIFLVFSLCIVLSAQASPRKAGNRRNLMKPHRRNQENVRKKRIGTQSSFPLSNGVEQVVLTLPNGLNGANQGRIGGGNPGGPNQGGINGAGIRPGKNGGVITHPVGVNGGVVVGPGGGNQGPNGGGSNPDQGEVNGEGVWVPIVVPIGGGGINQGFDGGVNPGGLDQGGFNQGGVNQGGVNGGGVNQGGVNGGGVNGGGVNGGIPIGVNPGGPNIPYNGDDDCPFSLYLFGLCDTEEDYGDYGDDHNNRK